MRLIYTKRILVIISFLLVLFGGVPAGVGAETLYILPQAQEVYEGDTFIVEVRINDVTRGLRKLGTEVVLGGNHTQILDAWYGDIFSFTGPTIVTPETAFFKGIIQDRFIGDGLVGRIMIKAKNIGQGKIAFDPSSLILTSASGDRTTLYLEASIEIVERPEGLLSITSRNHPDQDQWYGGKTVHLSWPFDEDSLYSFAMTQDPIAVLDDIPDRPEGELAWIGDMAYELEGDGIYYFHVKECKQPEDSDECIWGPKATHRLMIDSQPPSVFDVSIIERYGVSYAAIFARDNLSGIDYFEIAEISPKTFLGFTWGKSNAPPQWIRTAARYELQDQTKSSTILVKVVDGAGNPRILEVMPASSLHALDQNILLLSGILFTLPLILGGGIIWFTLTREKRRFYAE